jgi:hypothetical protein
LDARQPRRGCMRPGGFRAPCTHDQPTRVGSRFFRNQTFCSGAVAVPIDGGLRAIAPVRLHTADAALEDWMDAGR